MDKKKIIQFFDQCASWWDDDMIRNEDIICKIFDNCEIDQNSKVLDVACGTGVLFEDYLKRNVSSLTGIDISSEMVKVAKSKYPSIPVLCEDVETMKFDEKFNRIMVYNAFPHFSNPKRLIEHLSSLLSDDGLLSIAHSMSREALLEHHKRAQDVSIDLLEISELVELFKPYFNIKIAISNDKMYQIVGQKKH